MDIETYQQEALRSESIDKAIEFVEGTSTPELRRKLRLLHAGIGLTTEAGEFIDQLKKHIFYGRELDEVNLREELGDLLWYIAVAASALEIDLRVVMARNIAKLKVRYPDKFTTQAAVERDLDAERAVM